MSISYFQLELLNFIRANSVLKGHQTWWTNQASFISSQIRSVRARCLYMAIRRSKRRTSTDSHRKAPSFQTQSLPRPSAHPTAPCYSRDGTHRQPDTSLISSGPGHDEIGLGDVFSRNGYRTAWVGKWHLHPGSFPRDRRS